MEPPCLFCLDPVSKESIENPTGCECKISAHKDCFDKWFEEKNRIECPICHRVAIPTALTNENVRIVFVNMGDENIRRERYNSQEKATFFCCLMIMGWTIGITILEYIIN